MEFGNIGQHCAFSTCHQQDFLPFECAGCHHIYCTDHARADDHKCSLPMDYDSIIVIICPICEERIKLQKKDDPNQAWYNHSIGGKCIPKKQSGQEKPAKKCMAERCYARLNTINSLTCPKCLKEVCMKHRFDDDHQCTHIVQPVRNDKTAKSKLLQPGYFKQTQQQASQPVITQSEQSKLEQNIGKFAGASSAPISQPQQNSYTPERCQICGSLFLDVTELIAHCETHFQQEQSKKTETEKCPHCPKRFAIAELPTHMQMDHFIF